MYLSNRSSPRNQTRSRRYTRPPRVKRLLAMSSFVMLVFGIIVLYLGFREYDKAIEKGRIEAERLVTILSDQIELTFLTVDLSLQRAVERQYLNLLFGGNLPRDMVHNLNLWVEEIPQIVAMLVANENGSVELAVHDKRYNGWLDYNESLKNSLPYQVLKKNRDLDMYIGPFSEDNSRYPNLVLTARRINKLNGDFGGVVMAAVHSDYFLEFFESIDSGISRYVGITLNQDTDILADLDHPLVDPALSGVLLNGSDAVVTDSTTRSIVQKIDDSQKIIARKKVEKLPLVVSVVIDESDFLSGFWQDRYKDFSFLLFLTLFGSVLSFFAVTMAKQIVRVEESEAAAILASQAKSEFLANMSHELRTPLNAIIGFSEMMNSGYFGPLNAKQKERMQDINLCGNHLLHLISDILEFSKGEAGKLEIVEEKVDVPQIINETIRMMNEKIKTKGIKVNVEASEALPRLFADKRKLKQILINLISNAVKFTPQQGEISITARLEPNGNMIISVIDSGIGIADEDIQTALAVFGQVHRSHSHEGTGLGLPLCRMFVELHGGKLNLSSIVGEGTTVRVIFPAQRVMHEVQEEEAA
jgi:signal transduction histidine kinase